MNYQSEFKTTQMRHVDDDQAFNGGRKNSFLISPRNASASRAKRYNSTSRFMSSKSSVAATRNKDGQLGGDISRVLQVDQPQILTSKNVEDSETGNENKSASNFLESYKRIRRMSAAGGRRTPATK